MDKAHEDQGTNDQIPSRLTTHISGGQVRSVINAAGNIIMQHSGSNEIPNALNQLPPIPGDFTGREAELDDLISNLEKRGLTISGIRGMGGIGKTALALKLSHKLKAKYPDAQFFLDLKGDDRQTALTTSQAMSYIIRAYFSGEKMPEGGAELSALYHSVLTGKKALLLMDNALDELQVAPLIPPEGCMLVVTSRQHFNLPGLFAKNINTLPPEDARKFLLKIAPRVGEHANALARLCGYLPLALRLAANALAKRISLTPTEYLKELTKRQEQLKLIDASISLSYKMLPPEWQALWRTLAVFREAFVRSSVANLWGIPPDETQQVLDEMVSYSLVEWDETTGRYRLHDLVRVFADSQLSQEERTAAIKRRSAPPDQTGFSQHCEELIKTYDPREREAVEYLRWMKGKIHKCYFPRLELDGREPLPSIQGLQYVWECFIDFLNSYRKYRNYTRSHDYQNIERQLKEIQDSLRQADEIKSASLKRELESLNHRLINLDKARQGVKLLEAQLYLIENFLSWVHERVELTHPYGSIENFEKVFELVLLETVLPSIESAKEAIKESEDIIIET